MQCAVGRKGLVTRWSFVCVREQISSQQWQPSKHRVNVPIMYDVEDVHVNGKDPQMHIKCILGICAMWRSGIFALEVAAVGRRCGPAERQCWSGLSILHVRGLLVYCM